MKAFFGLALISFWLTVFPLKGYLLAEKNWVLLFLPFHSLGYFLIFWRYPFFENLNFLPSISLFIALFTILFPYFPSSLQILFLILMALFSPLLIMRALDLLKRTPSLLWPYTGIIAGNLTASFLEYLSLPTGLSFFLAGLLPGFLFLIHENAESSYLPEKEPLPKELIYLLFGIFIFYLTGAFIYEWIQITPSQASSPIRSSFLYYSLGILFVILFLKEGWWDVRELFVFSSFFLAIASALSNFENVKSLTFSQIFPFFASGLMDVLTIFYFINFFKNLRNSALLFFTITLSLFTGEVFLRPFIAFKSYQVLILNLFSFFSLYFFYKAHLTFKSLSISTLEKEVDQKLEESEIKEPIKDQKESPEENELDWEDFHQRINNLIPENMNKLSSREAQVLYYYAVKGLNLSEIAGNFGLSRSTVRQYLKRASFKLGVPQSNLKAFIESWLGNL